MSASESINISRDAQGVYANYNFKNNTKVKVNLYNTLGEQVGNTQYTTVQNKGRFVIETPQLAKGIYSVEVVYDNRKITRKMEF